MSFFRRSNEKKQAKKKNASSDQGGGTTSASINGSVISSSTSHVSDANQIDPQSVLEEVSSNRLSSSSTRGRSGSSVSSRMKGGEGQQSSSVNHSNSDMENQTLASLPSLLLSNSTSAPAAKATGNEVSNMNGSDSSTNKNRSNDSNKKSESLSVSNSMSDKEVDYDVNPTLLYKFIEKGEWDEAMERCKVAPVEACTWVVRHEWKNKNADECIDYENDTDKVVRWRMLPIHSAVIFKAPLDLVKAVLQAYPEGIHGADDRKMLPIHLCCRHLTKVDVAKYLITTDTGSLSRTDYKGRTPLAILREYKDKEFRRSKNKVKISHEERMNRDALIKIIEDLKITQNSKIDTSSREVDYDSTPTVLIKLIERKMWKQAISRCEDYPEEASTWMCRLQEVKENSGGKKDVKWKILPIHSAIILHSPVEVIETLIDAYPQGLRKGDDRKMLPLHMAFRIGASLDVTAVLVDAYPDALKKRDIKGHTPIHILKAYERKYEKEDMLGNAKEKDTLADKNRKRLIRFYLGSRKYGDDDDETLAPYDSEDDSSQNSDGSTIFEDEEDEYDGLFYRNMLTDISEMAMKGLTALPGIVRDTFTCRT